MPDCQGTASKTEKLRRPASVEAHLGFEETSVREALVCYLFLRCAYHVEADMRNLARLYDYCVRFPQNGVTCASFANAS